MMHRVCWYIFTKKIKSPLLTVCGFASFFYLHNVAQTTYTVCLAAPSGTKRYSYPACLMAPFGHRPLIVTVGLLIGLHQVIDENTRLIFSL